MVFAHLLQAWRLNDCQKVTMHSDMTEYLGSVIQDSRVIVVSPAGGY